MPDVIERPGLLNALCDVEHTELEPRIARQVPQVLRRAGDQIIEAYYVATLGKKAVAQMGADEAGSSGNKMTHRLIMLHFGVTMFEPSPSEMLLAAVLLAASLAGFWWSFGPVFERILAAKPGANLQPIGRRLWESLWEVMLQAKVIRERPLPGVAHALVFWGFCAFALVTLNHLAVGFGFAFLSRQSFYHYFAAAFGVAVAISIVGLFVRRFFVRPKWLGEKVSIESGVIAALIFVLMVTYLATFPLGDTKALWWAHTLALAAFLPLIPRTKHMHLILSPFSVFLSRRFAVIPHLSGEDDFGLVNGSSLTRLNALQAYSCVECGRCTEHCPAYNTGKVLDPREIALGVRPTIRFSKSR